MGPHDRLNHTTSARANKLSVYAPYGTLKGICSGSLNSGQYVRRRMEPVKREGDFVRTC